ncbi:hypothetical protein Clacol_010180 [Clathrus columnatus]|uniref:Uncharacterized protein n=1 Tax=Clathrus columnatus TaxID=1419009 RepID=A0AAV5AMJ0_9AGAM|nr:hypothetical protein Clacol_010180 [Clathrus columnatus]
MYMKTLFSSLFVGLLATCSNARAITSQNPAVLAACPRGDASIIRRELLSGLNEETGLTMTQVQCVDDSTTTTLDDKLPSELMGRQFTELCTQTCQTFIAAPGVTTFFELGTCTTRFFHNQEQPISVCFSWMNGLLPTMNECFQTPPQNGAECNQANADFSFDLTLFP